MLFIYLLFQSYKHEKLIIRVQLKNEWFSISPNFINCDIQKIKKNKRSIKMFIQSFY